MLELVKQELVESGVDPSQFISINFEDMRLFPSANREGFA